MIRWVALMVVMLLAQPAMAWDLGDLADPNYSDRLDIEWNRTFEWADAVDTQAELEALGWSVVQMTNANCGAGAISCAAGGSGSSEDETCVNNILSTNCPAGNCGNKIFRFQDSCTYDFTADSPGGTDSGGAITAHSYSNLAFVGGGVDTELFCNNTVTGPTQSMGPCLRVGSTWSDASGVTNTYSGSVTGVTKGSTEITLPSCTGLSSGDQLRVVGTDGSGEPIEYQDEVSGLAGCVATLRHGIPMTFTATSAQRVAGNNKNVYILNLKLGSPFLPDGAFSQDVSTINGATISAFHTDYLLLSDVWLGPTGAQGIMTRWANRIVVKHSTIDKNVHTARRKNNAAFISNANGFNMAIYDNWFRQSNVRAGSLAGRNGRFQYFGFNYQDDQSATAPETGNYCAGIGNVSDPTYPELGSGPERSIFASHDAIPRGNGTFLVESSTTGCRTFRESADDPVGQYGTFYRVRASDGSDPVMLWNATTASPTYSPNFIANRYGSYTWSGSASQIVTSLGLWNVGESSMSLPSDSSLWTGNEATTGANSNCPLDLPASLAFRSDTPPSWWCDESGDWTAWTFGACDGQGGVTYQLPAQLRAEGTCTLSSDPTPTNWGKPSCIGCTLTDATPIP